MCVVARASPCSSVGSVAALGLDRLALALTRRPFASARVTTSRPRPLIMTHKHLQERKSNKGDAESSRCENERCNRGTGSQNHTRVPALTSLGRFKVLSCKRVAFLVHQPCSRRQLLVTMCLRSRGSRSSVVVAYREREVECVRGRTPRRGRLSRRRRRFCTRSVCGECGGGTDAEHDDDEHRDLEDDAVAAHLGCGRGNHGLRHAVVAECGTKGRARRSTRRGR